MRRMTGTRMTLTAVRTMWNLDSCDQLAMCVAFTGKRRHIAKWHWQREFQIRIRSCSFAFRDEFHRVGICPGNPMVSELATPMRWCQILHLQCDDVRFCNSSAMVSDFAPPVRWCQILQLQCDGVRFCNSNPVAKTRALGHPRLP
jgi:hypothetical protein